MVMFGKIGCGETHLYHEEGIDEGFYLRKETDPPLLLPAPLHPAVLCSRSPGRRAQRMPGPYFQLRAEQSGLRRSWELCSIGCQGDQWRSLEMYCNKSTEKGWGSYIVQFSWWGCTWTVKNAGL